MEIGSVFLAGIKDDLKLRILLSPPLGHWGSQGTTHHCAQSEAHVLLKLRVNGKETLLSHWALLLLSRPHVFQKYRPFFILSQKHHTDHTELLKVF